MIEKPTNLHTIGLEWNGSKVKAAQLSLAKGTPYLERVFEISVDGSNVTEPSLQETIKKHLSVTVLDSDEVLIRPIDIKLKRKQDIEAVLPFQTEPLLPYPIESALLDWIELDSSNEGFQVNVLAAQKDHLQTHLERWQTLNVEPEIVSCVPAALALFGKYFSPESTFFMVHLSESSTTCILVRDGKLIGAQSTHLGLRELHEAAGETPLTEIDFAALLPKNSKLFAAFETWRLDVVRLLYALAKQRKETDVNGVLLVGEGATLFNLGKALCHSMQTTLLHPVTKPSFTDEELLRFAVPIGAALSALPKQIQVNFRQGELSYSRPWKRFKQPLAIYYLLCVVLGITVSLFGNAYLNYQEDQLRQDYVLLLTSLNRPYSSFEREFRIKHKLPLIEDDQIVPIISLSANDLEERIETIRRDMKENVDLFPLQPGVPRVSDVLAWFSNHPLVKNASEESPESPAVQLESFNYSLVRRPEPKKAQEKYQVKVEIQFSALTPTIAREFHDALIAPNELVDPKAEVKWSANKGKYIATFFLKDKTFYPASSGGS